LQSVVRPARVDGANEAEELAEREARERKADRNAGGDEKKFREYGHGESTLLTQHSMRQSPKRVCAFENVISKRLPH
jgi:hypothetical protein